MTKAKTLSVYSFVKLFPDEASAVSYIEKTLWGDSPICPYCNGTDTTIRRDRKGYFKIYEQKNLLDVHKDDLRIKVYNSRFFLMMLKLKQP